MQLRRDKATGRILDATNPIILAGGAYYLFKDDGLGHYALYTDIDPSPEVEKSGIFYEWYARGSEPCQRSDSTTKQVITKYWQSFAQLFSDMKEQGNNLLRIFLTNSFVASDVFPYHDVNGKLAVQDAVENGNWNAGYFNRLRTFAQQADASGIALQLSVFNFFDFDARAWPNAPWNPDNAHDITPGWSSQHLVPGGGTRDVRCYNFMNVTNANLTKVKQAFINKLVETLRGQGNIIFELINEARSPQGTPASHQARFLSHTTGLLLTAFGSWRPLLSVNAFPPTPVSKINIDTVLDIDAWKSARSTLPHYDAIDLLGYHGVSSLAAAESECGTSVLFPFVDEDSINLRTQTHLSRYPDKAMMYSTDGAKVYDHNYVGGTMSIRDGQIWCAPLSDTTATAFEKRHKSSLSHWAYWCLKQAFANPGRCHFQNHSSYRPSFVKIKESYAKASGQGSDGGGDSVFTPPFAAGVWTTWRWQSAPTADFFTASRLDANLGSVVVQLGTVASPADASQTGNIEVGFLHVFTATSGRVSVVAKYSPKSVTVRSNGGQVAPLVALRLHAIEANGSVGALVARTLVPLSPGVPSGQMELSAGVAAGQRYALILTAGVGIQYHNRAQGYGEVIVSYPQTSLFVNP